MMGQMYSLHGIRKGLKQPRYILQELNRMYYQRLYSWEYNEAGLDVFEADWDTLLILDACRYDLFERVSDLPGKTTAVRSKGSATEEFLRANFDGKRLHDTVYVTGEAVDIGTADSLTVGFQYRPTGADSWQRTPTQTISSTGRFSTDLADLQSETTYEFRAVVEQPDTVVAETFTFQTDERQIDPPVIDQFESIDQSTNGWTRYDVDWTVSSGDGDLDTVVTELLLNGRTVRADSTVVSGETASYTHFMRVRGAVDEVRLIVTDTENRVTSESKDL
jgi:hypothetical protein